MGVSANPLLGNQAREAETAQGPGTLPRLRIEPVRLGPMLPPGAAATSAAEQFKERSRHLRNVPLLPGLEFPAPIYGGLLQLLRLRILDPDA